MARARLAGLVLCMLAPWALGACVAYEPAPVDLDRLPAAYAQRSLEQPELVRFVAAFLGTAPAPWPPASLDLATLQAVALYHSQDLRGARLHVAQTTADRVVSGQLANPRLAVGPGLVTNAGTENRWLATLGLVFPLDLFGQRGARAEAADADVAAARVAVARTDLQVRADVVERALAVHLAVELDALAAETVPLRQLAVELAERRLAGGAASAFEVSATRTAASRAAMAKVATARDADGARAALAVALGLPMAALGDRAVTLPSLPGDVDAARAQQDADAALRQRLDVAAALCDYARREAELRLEVARQWPDLEFGPGYEYDQGLHKFRFDLGLTLPLFHGNGAAIDKAKADRSAAAATVEAAQTRALGEIEVARQRFARWQTDLAAARALVRDSGAAAAAAQRRAELGAADEGQAIQSRIDAVEARTLLVQLEHGARLAWLHLERALQQPIGPGLLAWQHALPKDEP